MATTKLRETPSELPHAHTYLDDVEEICGVFRDALVKHAEENEFFFTTSDHRMDSIADLEKHGGSATEFSIHLNVYSDGLRIYKVLSPELKLVALDNEAAWAVHAKVKAIFEARQYALKNAITRLPEWLQWAIAALAIPMALIMVSLISALHTKTYFFAVGLLIVLCIVYALCRPSRVSFVRFNERSHIVEKTESNGARLFSSSCLGA